MAKTTNSVNKAEPVSAAASRKVADQQKGNGGFMLNAANWLLSRLPWFKYRYQDWSKTKRIWIGLLMYLICLPIIPLVVGIVMYIHDPEGFKKGNAIKVVGAVFVVWAGLFGLVASQPAVPDNPLNSTAKVDQFNKKQKDSPEAKQADNADELPADQKGSAYQKVKDKTTSANSKGRFFKNCDAAFDAGVFNIARSDSSYQDRLDRDNDGIACEK